MVREEVANREEYTCLSGGRRPTCHNHPRLTKPTMPGLIQHSEGAQMHRFKACWTMLAALALLPGAALAGGVQREQVPGLNNISLRGGVMASPRGAALVGFDYQLPALESLQGFEPRLDLDIILKANLGGINTLVPATLSLIKYVPATETYTPYWGGGVGAVLGGSAKFDAKLIVGFELSRTLAVEANYHLTTEKNLLTAAARLKF